MPTARRPYTPRRPPEERREQLLDAAIAIIARDGYAGISIDAIAREAGVTRPVVYGVFAGLGPLLYALLDRQEQRALGQLAAALPTDLDGGDPGATLILAVRRLAEAVRADPTTWRPVLLAPDTMPAAVRDRIASDREVVRQRLRTLLEAGARQLRVDDLDAEIAAHAAIGVAEYFGRLIVEDPEGFDTERLVRAVGSLLRAVGL
ncbi:MAG TPA: TetR/AcrR family transcriptional regulator [Solirubrobacteraceae bacterium]|jgi:AcrR family transcriptional regulator|nr:TetR/AcrR family transcriptional regulator [Solirubrobacteraceae bacterium]